jgi:hypothetical protein
MQEELLLPGETVVSSRKISILAESSFWLGVVLLVLSMVSFVILSVFITGFLSISEITSRVGLNLSGYFWGNIPIIPSVLAVVGFLYVLYAEMDVLFKEYIVTTSKIIVKTGIINKKSSVLLPSKIEDVNVDVSILERALGLGTVIIVMQMDTKPPVVLSGIKEPYKLQTDILKLIGKRTEDAPDDKNESADHGVNKTS